MIKKISFKDKILIAGSSGMVGSAICRMLKVYGYGSSQFEGKLLTPTRKELNLIDKESVRSWFSENRPTVVIIAAAKVGGIYANSNYPADFLLDNLNIEINLIETSWQFGIKRLLFLGSSCIYPKFASQPISEESFMTGELEPTNEPYAIAKIAGIKLCEALRKQHGFDAISLMPTNLYGPGDNYHPTNSHVFASLIKKFCEAKVNESDQVICWGTGKALREFLHVDDLAKAVIFALENWDPLSSKVPIGANNKPLNILNVGTGKDISIFDLAHKISREVGYKGEIIWDTSKPDGTPRKLLDTEKLNKMGWEPEIDLNRGINLTIEEFMNNHIFKHQN